MTTMTVTCPSCGASFPVDPAKIPAGGVKARCSACSAIIDVQPPAEEAPSIAAIAPEPPAVEAPSAPSAGIAVAPDVPEVSPEPDFGTREAPIADAPEPHVAPDADMGIVPEPDFGERAEEVEIAVDQGIAPDAGIAADSGAEIASDQGGAPDAGTGIVPDPGIAPDTGMGIAPDAGISPDSGMGIALDQGIAADAGIAPPPAAPAEEPTIAAAPEVPAAPEPPAAPAAPIQFGKRTPEDKAKSLARSLVSDIIAYHPEKHQEAKAAGTLPQTFEEEVEKCWKEYQEQVDPGVVANNHFFNDALNDVLADGQPVFNLQG